MWYYRSDWSPPRGYTGLRTSYRHAIRVKIPHNRPRINIFTDEIIDPYDWCDERCTRNWSTCDGFWWFDSMSDALMFKLTFGGET